MYGEIETLVNFYNWSLKETKQLTVRERRHWYALVKAKIENKR